MDHISTNKHAQPCIWMSAGLLSYKLCDRDWECERCPLDAALRGQVLEAPLHTSLMSVNEQTSWFPDDLLYSSGHLWLRTLNADDGRIVRFGLDVFAATIIGRCCDVSCPDVGQERAQGESLCEIDLGLGILLVGAPVGVAVVAQNTRLERDPNALVSAPYGDGWIADLRVQDPSQLRTLSTAERARDQTKMDLRRFRRRVALQLLADTEGIGPCLPDGGELADLRQILAGPAYLKLIGELVH